MLPAAPAGGFDWQFRTRIVFGPGVLARLGEAAQEIGARRALVVTDAGIVAAGHVVRALAALEGAGVAAAVFDAVRENPDTADVDACVAAARDAGADLLVGLGGGSSIDTAKGAAFLLGHTGAAMRDFRGVGKATRPMPPLVAVPTSAGTGSEVQSFALIADAATHQKMACGDAQAAPRVALLDPELTLSQPRRVTACTGLDAVAHAVETAVTKRRTVLSWMFSREAFRLLAPNLGRVLESPGDVEARGAMLLGAAWAGLAIEASMLGAAHSAANPLTARFGVVHGHAVTLLLPHVVRFNAVAVPDARAAYAELAPLAGVDGPDGLADWLASLLPLAGLPSRLSECGVTAETVPALAGEAAAQWTAAFNPRKAGVEEFARLYRAAL